MYRRTVRRRRFPRLYRARRTRRVRLPVTASLIVATLITTLIVAVVIGRGGTASGTAGNADPLVVLYTKGDAETAAVRPDASTEAQLVRESLADHVVVLLAVNGNGRVQRSQVDLTPRYGTAEDHVVSRRLRSAAAAVSRLDRTLARSSTTAPGRSLLAGLQALADVPGSRVVALSSGLDLLDPLDLRRIGWDEPPQQIVAFLREAGELPRLAGRSIHLVLLPPAGAQALLGQPERDHLFAMWSAILAAAGARATVTIGADDPSGSTFAVPVVPVPPPVQWRADGCTVTASALFVYGTATLFDRPEAVRDLAPCAAAAASGRFRVLVVGHTSQDPGAGPDDGIALSRDRAGAVRDLFVEQFHVPAALVTAVGVGALEPVCTPADAACNRVVVVTFQPRT